MMNIHKKKFQGSGGLTLIETLMAITILLTAVVAPLVIYSNSISNATYARDQIIASFLAREAIEFVKYKINTNFNAGTDWLIPDLSPCIGVDPCTIDSPNDIIAPCAGGTGSCPKVLLDPTSGLYNHVIGTETMFRREVAIESPFYDGSDYNDYDALVSVTVSWTRAGKDKSVTIKEHVFEWR